MAVLMIPTEGPCAGHPCDNCRICQRGRCCRNDNPHYELPHLGDWDGPIHGELGFLEDDGEKVCCHACGEYFHQLGVHAFWAHDLTSDEYRAVFGLRAKTPLAGPSFRSRAKRNKDHLSQYWHLGREAWLSLTPEQRSARIIEAKKDGPRLESTRNPRWREARLEAARAAAPKNSAYQKAHLRPRNALGHFSDRDASTIFQQRWGGVLPDARLWYLTEKQWRVTRDHALLRISYQAIAEDMGVTNGTVNGIADAAHRLMEVFGVEPSRFDALGLRPEHSHLLGSICLAANLHVDEVLSPRESVRGTCDRIFHLTGIKIKIATMRRWRKVYAKH